jgi:long-subunit acyl-CoA synthetase (AMP-forming)
VRGVERWRRALEPWSIENGLITPTLKLRRTQIEQRFHAEIERLFAERAPRTGLIVAAYPRRRAAAA